MKIKIRGIRKKKRAAERKGSGLAAHGGMIDITDARAVLWGALGLQGALAEVWPAGSLGNIGGGAVRLWAKELCC